MTKKIRDIRPPQKKSLSNSRPKEKKNNFKTSKKRFNWSKLFLLFLIPVIIGGILFFWDFTKAEIQVWPQKNEKDLSVTVEIVDKEQKDFDGELWIDKKIIPGQFVTSTQKVSDTFESSGTVKEKAKGTVKIFNNYSPTPQTFRAQTRLMSDDGKTFKTTERVTVPGKPESVEAEVVAAEAGEEYNIDSSTFSIPGLNGTDLYGQFIGKSFEPMTGGGTFSQVTEEDIEDSKEQLKKKAINYFQNEFNDLEIILEGSSIDVLEFDSSKKEEEKAEKFKGELEAEMKTLGFKEKNIKEFTRAYVLDQISAEEKIVPDTLKMDYKVKEKKLEDNKIILKLDISVEIYKDIKEAIIKKELTGKTLKEAEMILQNQEGIEDIKVDLWPFWTKQIPKNGNKIKVELNLD